MERVNDEIIQEIRRKSDIVDIISSYISLTPRGKNYFGVCPFHDDNHPSMSVSTEKQIYKCFSCGASGNVFKFVSDYENIPYIEAVRTLGEKCGITIASKVRHTEKRNEELYDMYALAHKFYQNNINTKEGRNAKIYLQNRKLEENVIKEFGIGLALKDNTMLSKLLTSKNFRQKNLENSGLLVHKEMGYTDLYYNRIMFPLWNINGEVVGFSGRIYEGMDTSKYINTRETEIFKKGEILYNYHRAKNEARKVGTVLIMEGFMDVIRAYTIGVTNVVATMGTAVTAKQASLIKRMAKEVILCFDGDDAGGKATLACSEELLKIGVTPKVIRLEDDLDPDEYILKKGKEAFLEKMENPINIMDFKLQYLKKGKNLNSATDTAAYLNTMIEELLKIEDDILRELTLQKMSEETGLEVSFLRVKLEEKIEKKPKILKEEPKRIMSKKKSFEKAQEYLLYYMLLDKEVIKSYINAKSFFPTDAYRALALEIVHFYKETSQFVLADFLTEMEGKEDISLTVKEIMSLPLKEEYSKEEIGDYIITIREYNIQSEIKRLQKKMREEVSPIGQAQIAKEIVALKVEESKI